MDDQLGVVKEFESQSSTMKCNKIKYDKLGAMLALVSCKSKKAKSYRLEKRYYYCKFCKAYHLTKQNVKKS